MARLWDQNLADKATAIDQATKLGGVVVAPPKQTGFAEPEPERAVPAYEPLPLDD